MLFKRKIYDKLIEWKKNGAGEKALLIEGARRIGKSTIVEEFAKREYRSYLLIDFNRVAGHFRRDPEVPEGAAVDQEVGAGRAFRLYRNRLVDLHTRERKGYLHSVGRTENKNVSDGFRGVLFCARRRKNDGVYPQVF